MIKNLEDKMEKMQESINKNLEELKNKHTEINNTVMEIKKNNEKAEKYCTNEGTNQKHRSPKNEEGIGKLPEKEFRIMRVKMIKNLENRMEKMQELI